MSPTPNSTVDLSARAAIRRDCLKLREQLSRDKPEAGETLASNTISYFDLVSAWPHETCEIAGYWPKGSEIDPRPFMKAFEDKGYGISLPRLNPHLMDGGAYHMDFARYQSGDTLEIGPFNILQPSQDKAVVVPDVLMVPLLGFDDQWHRIGYGGGYYDRALLSLRAQKPIKAWGVAFAEQLIDRIVVHEGDQALDGMLCDTSSHFYTL